MTRLPTEDDVIGAVEGFLRANGWAIEQSRNTRGCAEYQ